jgi:3-dehydroquinate dehydratase type I
LCVPIFVESKAQAHRQAALAAEHGADLVEYRMDVFDPHADPGLVEASPLPCIVTCRPVWEGGESELSDVERIKLLNSQLQMSASYADVELAARDAFVRLALEDKRYILSVHYYKNRPERLYNHVAE